MIINGIVKYNTTFRELDIGEIFSFASDRKKIWDDTHDYERPEKEGWHANEDDNEYMGEKLYMLCWKGDPVDFNGDNFHPKFISLSDGCLHDIIEEQEFIMHDYYSDVCVYDSCREMKVGNDEDE